MKNEIEQKLWNAGQEKESYTQKEWYKIIDALLLDFKQMIGEDFYREREIYLDVDLPSFGQKIWAKEIKKDPLSVTWSAIIGGGMIGIKNRHDVFCVSLTLFLFDVASKKRLCLNTGESVIEFVFEKQSNSQGYWHSLGWHKDANYEWENIEWSNFN